MGHEGEQPGVANFGGRAPRILVIEDDPDAASLLVEAINDHFNDESAHWVERLGSLGSVDLDAFDLAMCDYNLPDGVGLDAMRMLHERRDDLPIVMVTGEREVALAVKAVRGGAADYVVKSGDYFRVIPIVIEKNLETARMKRDNLRLQAALARSLADLKRKNRELESLAARLEVMASTDVLTNLANRRRFQDRLHAMFSEAVRYANDLACLMIDLDCFKVVNDTHGHHIGDELLEATGRLISAEVRASDVAARYGGDEFAVLLPHTTHDTALSLAHRLLDRFAAEAIRVTGDESMTGMSIGVASLSLSRPMSPHQLLMHADRALYAAKGERGPAVMICGKEGAPQPAPRSTRAA